MRAPTDFIVGLPPPFNLDPMRGTGENTRPLPPDLLIERTVFESPLVAVGIFRAGVGHPAFQGASEIRAHLFAFPRYTVRITPEGSKPFMADPWTVAFYNAGQVITRAPVDPNGDACDLFAVRPDVLVDVLAGRDASAVDRPDGPFPFSHGPSDPETYALQRQLLRHVETATVPDQLAIEEATLWIVESIVDRAYERFDPGGAVRPAADSAESDLAEAVRHQVIEGYRGNQSLEQIAAAVGRSVFYTCRVFRRQVGTTIHQFRHQLRLRKSLELVAEPRSDLSRVALHLGFSSHSHFTAAFRKSFGVTPSDFRRNPSTRRIRDLAERAGLAG